MLLISVLSLSAQGTKAPSDTRPESQGKHAPRFTVTFDLAGAVMCAATDWGQYEIGLKARVHERWYGALELGIGCADATDANTSLHYTTRAPYGRIGCDYNFLRRTDTGHRLYGGLRVAYSPFAYDISGPDIEDPVWGGNTPFQYADVKSHALWGEAVVGLETYIWRFVRLGWTVRYRVKCSEKKQDIGHAWYIPGYGKGKDHFGGTMTIGFEF